MFVAMILFLSFGRQYTQLYFHNCDKFILENNQLSSGSYIYKSFISRLKFILKRTFITCISLTLAAMVVLTLTGSLSEFVEISGLLIIGFSLLVFYETFHLLMYYLIQPFTRNVHIKKPFYRILGFAEMLISVAFILAKDKLILFIFPIALLPVISIIIGSLLVKKFGDRTFVMD